MKLTRVVLSIFAAAALCVPMQTALAQAEPAPGAAQPDADKPRTDDKKTEPSAKEEAKLVYVKMKTSMGDIVLELNHEKAPITVKNFLSYTDKKHYDGTIFHRVIKDFMIQGGGFDADLKQKPVDKAIKNEYKNGLKNMRGSIAMARTNEPDTATSQFFINTVDNPNLDMPRYGGAAYAVFGRVISGMDVVDKIRAVKTGPRAAQGMDDVPVEAVVIQQVTRLSEDDARKLMDNSKPEAKPDAPKESPRG